MDVGCFAGSVRENNIADTPLCGWTTSVFFKAFQARCHLDPSSA